jgi:hypothetical protein
MDRFQTALSLGEHALIKKAVGVLAATPTAVTQVGWLIPGWGGFPAITTILWKIFRQSHCTLGASLRLCQSAAHPVLPLW